MYMHMHIKKMYLHHVYMYICIYVYMYICIYVHVFCVHRVLTGPPTIQEATNSKMGQPTSSTNPVAWPSSAEIMLGMLDVN